MEIISIVTYIIFSVLFISGLFFVFKEDNTFKEKVDMYNNAIFKEYPKRQEEIRRENEERRNYRTPRNKFYISENPCTNKDTGDELRN